MLLFVPQSWADRALLADTIEISGQTMTVRQDGRQYRLEEAVRVLGVDSGEDAESLVGKVLSQAEIRGKGWEAFEESLLVGETAYRVQPGFLARYLGTGDPVSTVFRQDLQGGM